MPMPRLRSCCCGCYLRTGTLIILFYNLTWIILLSGFELYIRIKIDGIPQLALLIYHSIIIGSHILGIIGVITKIYLMLLPFIILQWAYLVLLVAFVVKYAISRDEFYDYVCGFIVLQIGKSFRKDVEPTSPPITEQEMIRRLLDAIRKNPDSSPLPFDINKHKKNVLIGAGVLIGISFILNLYFAIVVLSCLLEMREEEMWGPRRRTEDSDYDYD